MTTPDESPEERKAAVTRWLAAELQHPGGLPRLRKKLGLLLPQIQKRLREEQGIETEFVFEPGSAFPVGLRMKPTPAEHAKDEEEGQTP
jgi:hypothetical protein